MNENNTLVTGFLRAQFNMELMVSRISNKVSKASEGLPVSLPVTIPEKQNNMNDRDRIIIPV